MTGRERITAVLEGRRPDHVPFVPLIGRYYVKSLPEMGIPLEKIASWEKAVSPALKDELNMHEVETIRYVGADVLYRHVMAWRTEYNSSVIPFTKEKGKVRIEGFETPKGSLWQEVTTSGTTEYISRHMISGPEDMEIWLEIVKASRPVPFYSEPAEMEEFIGDDGLATLTGPVTPIQEMLQFKMGVENTTYALMDYPDLMTEIFREQHRLNLAIYEILAGAPASTVITYEDTSTSVISPSWYGQYCSDELDQYAEIIKGGGKHYIVHMCGNIKNLTGAISRGKMDGIDSVCPPLTGDLEPGDACREIRKLIIGGLDPVVLVAKTSEGCADYARGKLNQIPRDSRFMLSTGDSTAAFTPVENLRTISETVKEYQY